MAIRRAGHLVFLAAAAPTAADAQVSPGLLNDDIGLGQIVLMAALIGAVTFAVLATVQLIRARNRAEAENARLRLEVGDLKSVADRAEALVNEEDQRLVAWGAPGDRPLVAGSLPLTAGVPADRSVFLNFAAWLKPDSAARLNQLVAALRERGEHFQQVVATARGRLIEVRGRTVSGSAVARFRDLTGERLARAEIEARHDLLAAEVETTRAMLASAPMPIWLRDEKSGLVWGERRLCRGGRGQGRRGRRGARPRASRHQRPQRHRRRARQRSGLHQAPVGHRRRYPPHLRRRRHRLGRRQRRHRRRRDRGGGPRRRRSAARSISMRARSTSCRRRSPSSAPTAG
ncbi:MAG: hypothetical protein WDM84_00655 [Bauldia sp.]